MQWSVLSAKDFRVIRGSDLYLEKEASCQQEKHRSGLDPTAASKPSQASTNTDFESKSRLFARIDSAAILSFTL